MTSGSRCRGFTYLAVLFLVALAGLGLAAVGELWSHARQREKETDLLWIGEQYRQAIGLYYQRTPGTTKRYPEKLEDLLEDKRFLTTQRYLRRIYADPMTGQAAWGVIAAPGGGIMGVSSTSTNVSIRQFMDAKRYSEWHFVYEPPQTPRQSEQKPAR